MSEKMPDLAFPESRLLYHSWHSLAKHHIWCYRMHMICIHFTIRVASAFMRAAVIHVTCYLLYVIKIIIRYKNDPNCEMCDRPCKKARVPEIKQ